MFITIRTYIKKWLNPQPPTNAVYGYRWHAGSGVPVKLMFDTVPNLAPGIYIIFQPQHLDNDIDLFGRNAPAPGPVFQAPAEPSAALESLVDGVNWNPPANAQEAQRFKYVTPQRLCDIDGFLSYCARCLEIINATAAGAALLARINAGRYPIIIAPAAGMNQTGAGVGAMNALATEIANFANGQQLSHQLIANMVNLRYAAINNVPGRFNQLANDLNNMPLYSLFNADNAFTPNFLADQFRFQDEPLNGGDLMNWISPNGFPEFEQNLRTMNIFWRGVSIKQYFLLALNFALYSASPPGNGNSSWISFFTQNINDNRLGSADFRPPAVGLAHELMHAMHYSYGTSAGRDLRHFTTTAAELLFSGIAPFANEPITENAVRLQWNMIPAATLDASNVWAAPARRTIYNPPEPPDTPQSLRRSRNVNCI